MLKQKGRKCGKGGLKMERKKWVQSEQQMVNNKRCMQADVVTDDEGNITAYADTIRNRIRQAAVAQLGRPISVEDIGEIIGVKGPAVRAKMAGWRHFRADEIEKIEAWLGTKVFY